MTMAQIVTTAKSGECRRVALTDGDKIGRNLFVQWCKAAGLKITIDEMGNIFGRRDRRFNDIPPMLCGSHPCAGHDAVYVSHVVPTSKIFIPSKNGLSHNELEESKKEDVAAEANVLLH